MESILSTFFLPQDRFTSIDPLSSCCFLLCMERLGYMIKEKFIFFASRGVTRRRRNKIANVSNISYTNNLGRYLGFQMVHGRVTLSLFDFLVEKIQRRLVA
ncbi:hypothetical protein AAZX31_18G089500 [Glycine max]